MRIQYVLALLLVTTYLIGCGTTPHPVVIETTIPDRQGRIPVQVEPASEDSGERGIMVMVEEDNVGALQLRRVTESLTAQNYLELSLTFVNTDEEDPVNGEYRVQFFTRDGVPVERPIGWNPVSLGPKQTTYEKVVAPNETADYYKIQVKGYPVQESY
ncbi:MAG: hypothetical protein D6675_12960 [Gemmatimonadetes bacterium]|nr:MAG: hypothetical protein D6675_12960 [Gemmatimonadota bacterium]